MKDDLELVAKAMSGGPEKFGPIVERYQDAVFAIALARLLYWLNVIIPTRYWR